MTAKRSIPIGLNLGPGITKLSAQAFVINILIFKTAQQYRLYLLCVIDHHNRINYQCLYSIRNEGGRPLSQYYTSDTLKNLVSL